MVLKATRGARGIVRVVRKNLSSARTRDLVVSRTTRGCDWFSSRVGVGSSLVGAMKSAVHTSSSRILPSRISGSK